MVSRRRENAKTARRHPAFGVPHHYRHVEKGKNKGKGKNKKIGGSVCVHLFLLLQLLFGQGKEKSPPQGISPKPRVPKKQGGSLAFLFFGSFFSLLWLTVVDIVDSVDDISPCLGSRCNSGSFTASQMMAGFSPGGFSAGS
jgi:hypothetical protein